MQMNKMNIPVESSLSFKNHPVSAILVLFPPPHFFFIIIFYWNIWKPTADIYLF